GVKAEARTIGALAYAPNRMRVAYSLLTGTPNLWIMDVASGEKEDVLRTGSVTLSGDAAPVVIAWSPDGSRLAVVARGGNTVADLYVITLADKSVVKVSAASGALDSVSTDPMLKPEWAHDGQWMLAYIGQDLVRVSADGKQVMRITAGLPFGAFDLAPDDSAITYAIRRDADERVWIMDADGKNYRALTPAGTSRAPQFKPAGTQIFYVSRDAAAAQDTMWSINRDGSNPQQLAVVSGTIREFQLSPDGSRILFIEKSANGTQRLRIMRTNGLGLEDILTGGAYEPMGFAAWNQSGTAVLVAGMEEFLMEVEL
ncbi:MAG: LpqB family beta-propeller domain-containing protein, partial [Patescibacteria group bacterium]|nr:LpqB family beta-propeller domain-containing protein [Patescibacteria group bacterium]